MAKSKTKSSNQRIVALTAVVVTFLLLIVIARQFLPKDNHGKAGWGYGPPTNLFVTSPSPESTIQPKPTATPAPVGKITRVGIKSASINHKYVVDGPGTIPVLYYLHIKGGLPDSCKIGLTPVQTRNGNYITVILERRLAPDVVCLTVITEIEYDIMLEGEFNAGETYYYNINGYKGNFKGVTPGN